MSNPRLMDDLLSTVLKVSPYSSQAQKESCRKLVQELSLEEQEEAGCTSYAYWVRSTAKEQSTTEEERIEMAMREARRHFVGEDGHYDRALKSLREMCRFRKEHHINVFRTCFISESMEEECRSTGSYQDTAKVYCSYLTDELLSKQAMVVCGKDKDGKAIILKKSRIGKTRQTDPKAFIAAQLYISERAIACTEYLSGGEQEKVVAIFDFRSGGHPPPFGAIKAVAIMLQQHYPERLHMVLILHPPLWLKSLFYLMQPFLPPELKDKLRLVTGEAQKKKVLDPLLSGNQTASTLLSDSEGRNVDLDQFLRKVPFHCLYSEREEQQTHDGH